MRLLLVLTLARVCWASSAGNGISKSTYAATDPTSGAAFLYKYFPVDEAQDDCPNAACMCFTGGKNEPWEIVQGRVALMGANNNDSNNYSNNATLKVPPSTGFGLHLVNVSARRTTGGVSLPTVEAAFTARLGDMSAYDAFMDYNIGLLAADLTPYTSRFDHDAVDYYAASFEENSETWYSVFVLVPNTQMVLELLSTTYEGSKTPHPVAPRLGSEHARALSTLSLPPPLLQAIRVSRATSNLTAVDAFYEEVFGTTPIQVAADRHCFLLWDGDSTMVCYAEYTSDESDVLSVADFQNGMNDVHKTLLSGQPMCGKDKWLDNHYAYDNPYRDNTTLGNAIVAAVDSGKYMFYCDALDFSSASSSSYRLHYIIDPTGWGIQLDVDFPSQPMACRASSEMEENAWALRRSSSEKLASADSSNPACDLGICNEEAAI